VAAELELPDDVVCVHRRSMAGLVDRDKASVGGV
jgi:hypothetical protein